jgi:DNA repair exonuclease SbcCD ATPase subunit
MKFRSGLVILPMFFSILVQAQVEKTPVEKAKDLAIIAKEKLVDAYSEVMDEEVVDYRSVKNDPLTARRQDPVITQGGREALAAFPEMWLGAKITRCAIGKSYKKVILDSPFLVESLSKVATEELRDLARQSKALEETLAASRAEIAKINESYQATLSPGKKLTDAELKDKLAELQKASESAKGMDVQISQARQRVEKMGGQLTTWRDELSKLEATPANAAKRNGFEEAIAQGQSKMTEKIKQVGELESAQKALNAQASLFTEYQKAIQPHEKAIREGAIAVEKLTTDIAAKAELAKASILENGISSEARAEARALVNSLRGTRGLLGTAFAWVFKPLVAVGGVVVFCDGASQVAQIISGYDLPEIVEGGLLYRGVEAGVEGAGKVIEFSKEHPLTQTHEKILP